MNFLYFLIIGAVAGWLASKIMKGHSYGLLGNLAIGIVGAFVGGALFSLLNISAYGLLGALVTSTVGAVVLLWLVSVIAKRK